MPCPDPFAAEATPRAPSLLGSSVPEANSQGRRPLVEIRPVLRPVSQEALPCREDLPPRGPKAHLTPTSLSLGVPNACSGPGPNRRHARRRVPVGLRASAVPAPTGDLPGSHHQAPGPRGVYGGDDVLTDVLQRLLRP